MIDLIADALVPALALLGAWGLVELVRIRRLLQHNKWREW